jgi:hypothetical protein
MPELVSFLLPAFVSVGRVSVVHQMPILQLQSSKAIKALWLFSVFLFSSFLLCFFFLYFPALSYSIS